MIPIFIRVIDNLLGSRFKKKGSELPRRVESDARRLLELIKGSVQLVTPRGRGGCTGKGGNLRSAITTKYTGDGGQVFVNESIAPYVRWVIPGRGPVHAKGKKNGGADFLHFCIAGKHIFVKSVGPVKKNDFIKTGYQLSGPDALKTSHELGRWLTQV